MRVYSVRMTRQAVTAAITLVQLKAGNATLRLLRAWCGQSNLTGSAMQTVQLVRKSVAATVTSFTPLQLDPGDAAALAVGGTAATGTNASAEGTDSDLFYADSFNVLNGWLWVPTPEERIIIAPSGIIGIKLPDAPGSSMTTSAGFLFGEEG